MNPPDKLAIEKFAKMLDMSIGQVNSLVAREWYGIETALLPPDVADLALECITLDPEDLTLVSIVIKRLQAVVSEQPARAPGASAVNLRAI